MVIEFSVLICIINIGFKHKADLNNRKTMCRAKIPWHMVFVALGAGGDQNDAADGGC